MINQNTIFDIVGFVANRTFECDIAAPAFVCDGRKILSYLSDLRFLKDIEKNSSIKAIFVSKHLLKDINVLNDVAFIEVDDARDAFFRFHNSFSLMKKVKFSSRIANSAVVGRNVSIADSNVVIGNNVLIEDNVVIYENVTIKEGSIIRAGTVLGAPGFEFKRIGETILPVVHDGNVIIGKSVEIGPLCTIIQGFSWRDTIIDDSSKFDAHVHFAHGSMCGKRCFIAANAMIAGSVTVGDDVWIGPSATISNLISIGDFSSIAIGSLVVADVPTNTRVKPWAPWRNK